MSVREINLETGVEIQRAYTKQELDNLTAIPPEEIIKAQILAIEATITQRRLREATLGMDDGWLANANAEIAALRAKLP